MICAGESRFKKNITGIKDKNDKGIMQINKKTYDYFKKIGLIYGEWKDIFDIEYNIDIASVILKKYRRDLKRIFPNKTKKEIDKLLIESYNKGVVGTTKIVEQDGTLTYYKYIMSMKKLLKRRSQEYNK